MILLKRLRARPTLASAHFHFGSSCAMSVVPRQFPTTGFTTVPDSTKLEEENWAWYTPRSFYPVSIGDILHSKYQVLFKLGYGTTATIWLCRDLQQNEYVCMKSMVSDYSSVEREIKAYEVLGKVGKTSRLTGGRYVRQALDHFELHHGDCNYHFLIHEPLGVSLQLLLRIFKVGFPMNYVKDLASQMLHALAFIHSAGVIHADLQANNILLRIQDEIVFKDGEEAEIEHSSARKFVGQGQEQRQSVIFETRSHPGSLRRWIGLKSGPILCDFGEARTGKQSYTELIQPASYRAPEVFLHLPWGPAVDIWSFGCMIWDFLLDQNLFPRPSGLDTHTADQNQLARMVALLGPPPEALLVDSGPRALEFFNEDGSPKGEVPSETLESLLASSLEQRNKTLTAEESAAFLAFLRRALTWTEDGRVSAEELLEDPWIGDLSEKWR
ncbi:kinase-like domain-containing protein [Gymnopilus junonius]|uniref:Kinase-like domain-containing protein n=1 Tax=Gymnopilus junonius TaxID=109634 RepID=A0A9P5TK93_GYMJU|nr:kinase-like domain-containing protein [Gymnopilus junonius]